MRKLLRVIAAMALVAAAVFVMTTGSPSLAAPAADDPATTTDIDPADRFPAGQATGAPVLSAEGWATPANVSNAAGPSGAPSLAVDSAGTVHMAWYDNVPGNWDILYASKALTGTWTAPENVSSNASYSLVPSLVVDSADNVAIAWQDYGGPRIAWQGTLLYKAREPGQDFAPFEAISATSGFGGYPEVRDANLVVDGSSVTHLLWAGNTADGYRIFHARKAPGGLWSFPRVINPGSGAAFRPSAAIDADDRLHVVWQETPASTTQSDIYYATLSGDVWSPAANLSNNSGDSLEPRLLSGRDGALLVVWQDDSGQLEQAEILLAEKPAGGAWSAPVNISRTAGDSAGPSLVEDAAGALHLVWYDNTPGNWEILYAVRQSSGLWTSGANVSQTPGRSGQPRLFFDARNVLHLAWADDTPGDFDVYYTKKTVPVFASSLKQASVTALAGGNIAYRLSLRNPSAADVTLYMTDTMPISTTYVAGSVAATAGVASASSGAVYWRGVVPANGSVDVTFAAVVDAGVAAGAEIRNHAAVSDNFGVALGLEATTRIVRARLSIPIIIVD